MFPTTIPAEELEALNDEIVEVGEFRGAAAAGGGER
jgi:hypothetical protein